MKKKFYRSQAEMIIKKLQLRKMEGYYCENKEEALAKLLELIGDTPKTIANGGSVTLNQIGAKKAVQKAGHELVLKEKYENQKEWIARQATADVFMTSTNAITLDGELVNIDGVGSRVSMMIFGPDEVIVVAGMNKVVTDVEAGIKRIHNFAAPLNALRINADTPCKQMEKCENCLKNTICCNIVVTRATRFANRIKVILVGEELGF